MGGVWEGGGIFFSSKSSWLDGFPTPVLSHWGLRRKLSICMEEYKQKKGLATKVCVTYAIWLIMERNGRLLVMILKKRRI